MRDLEKGAPIANRSSTPETLPAPRFQSRRRFARTSCPSPITPELLDERQRRAVEYSGTHLLILAGAGSGKTRVLTNRASHLLKTVPAQNIVVMSFTIKAAQELYERLCELTQAAEMSQLWIGTFHSICRRILSENASVLGYSSHFGILDNEDRLTVLRRCVPQGCGIPIREVSELYSLSRNKLVPWQELLPKQLCHKQETIATTLDAYHRRMKKADRMDFDDLLANTITLLEDCPNVRASYQRSFTHILVDEFQDTSVAQKRILELLASTDNITVVGDDSQAIYGFRGAIVDNILAFEDSFAGATRITLEENYRSSPEILSIANDSITRNTRRLPKTLFSAQPQGPKPQVVKCKGSTDEAQFVVDEILKLYRLGTKLKSIAVLFRAGFCSAALQVMLQHTHIPFCVFGAPPFFSQPHVKDMLAWLAVTSNPEDSFSLSRIWPQQEGLTEELLAHVEAQADATGQSLWRTASDTLEHFAPLAKKALEELQYKISICRDEYQKARSVGGVLRTVISIHFEQYLKRTQSDSETKLQDIAVLVDVLSQYTSIEGFSEELAQEKLDIAKKVYASEFEDGDALSLSTVHAAKGLEWESVFVIGLVDGWFPHHKADDLEEERRVFHVAVTRAKRNLVLTFPEQDDTNKRPNTTSRFLLELPVSLVEAVSRPPGESATFPP